MINQNELKNFIEALLFLSREPLKPERIAQQLPGDVKIGRVREILDELKGEFHNLGRGFYICEMAGGYQFVTRPEHKELLLMFFKKDDRKTLTRASLEVLAIIAYKQPVTRAEIENIRGVDSGSSIKYLLNLRLIRITGKQDTPGRPLLYKTTGNFLKVFGLKDINELPDIEGQEVLFGNSNENAT